MRINILSNNNEEHCVAITGKITKDDKTWFREVLNHAWLKKIDVSFKQQEKMLTIKLKRYEEGNKAKRKFLRFVIWDNSRPPTKDCLLTIRDIEKCDIYNNDPDTQQMQEVIIGGVAINDNEIYIGSFCQHENAYRITLSVKRINITLEDI